MMKRLSLPCLALCVAASAAETFDPARLEREILVSGATDPLQCEVVPDGSVYFIERAGAVKKWDATARSVSLLGKVATMDKADTGLLGFVLARDFAASGRLFIYYCPQAAPATMRVAGFTMREGVLDLASEQLVIEMPIDGGNSPPHCGGGLAWDRDGHLLLGTGDNTPPQEVPSIHPDDVLKDARRSAANTQDLRGKILRITPKADGGYTIPKGNLFADPSEGRPEIYVMGTRNPFRLAVDAKTGSLIWGDVGGNVDAKLGLGPEGFDEINLAAGPGNYGWPFFCGPNLAWRPYDVRTKKPAGEPFDPLHPVNNSPRNTGAKTLPPARSALVWYPTSASNEWPQLGSGGRSVTGGPVYRFDEKLASEIKLPAHFDGCVLWGEWMRNFLVASRLPADGSPAGVERFMPDTMFHKPSDLKIGPEGALYVVEYGDVWGGNRDGVISRVVYHRGNRPPRVLATADTLAGKAPLRVRFDATGSTDPDAGDKLQFAWSLSGGKSATGATVEHTFAEAGRWPVELTVSDSHGGSTKTALIVAVGNAAPRVSFAAPLDGSFFEWAKPVHYQFTATDDEEGPLAAEQVLVQAERRDRAHVEDEAALFPGLGLMRAGTCFACHRAAEKSAGPAYLEVARRYAPEPAARERLATKIVSGGAGAWGEIPMPPHPQHTADQARQMLDWILSLASRDTQILPRALKGEFTAPAPGSSFGGFTFGGFSNGVLVLTATATDHGTPEAPPLQGETSVTLRTRRQHAAAFDRAHQVITQHNLEGGDGLVARLEHGSWFGFERIRLAGTKNIRVRLRPLAGEEATLELHLGQPDGAPAATVPLPPPLAREAKAIELNLPLPASSPAIPNEATNVFFKLTSPKPSTCELIWVEFR